MRSMAIPEIYVLICLDPLAECTERNTQVSEDLIVVVRCSITQMTIVERPARAMPKVRLI